MSGDALDKDKAEIAALIRDCYAMISGPAGPRDWSRQGELFHPDCRQMRTGVDANGAPWIEIFSPDQYAVNADALLSTMDFYEVELVNRIEVFGCRRSFEQCGSPACFWPWASKHLAFLPEHP